MDGTEGHGPEDWSYLDYPQDDRSDYRWAGVPGLTLIRGLVRWFTGTDPLVEMRRRELAKDQAESDAKFTGAEEAAYRHLGDQRDHPTG